MTAEKRPEVPRKISAGDSFTDSFDVKVGRVVIHFPNPRGMFPGIKTPPTKRSPSGGEREIFPEEILADPEKLNHYLKIHKEVEEDLVRHQGLGSEIWAQYNAHKGLVLTIVGATAAAAGIVGIGIHIKRRGDSKEEKK